MAQDRDAAQAFVDKWRPRVTGAQPRPSPDDAQRDRRRDARAQALLRAGRGRPHRPPRPSSRKAPAPAEECCRSGGSSSSSGAPAGRDRARQQPRGQAGRHGLCPGSPVPHPFQLPALAHRRNRTAGARWGSARRRAALPQCRRHRYDRARRRAPCSTSCSPSSGTSAASAPIPAPRGRSTSTSSSSVTTSSTSRAFRYRIRVSGRDSLCWARWPKIAPDLRDPVTGMRVADLLKRLLRDEGRLT